MNTRVVIGLGVLSILENEKNACPLDSTTPSLVRGEGMPAVGLANVRIKRSYLLRESIRKRLLTEVGIIGLMLTREYYAIADRIFRLEVWRQYPELIGKNVELCDGTFEQEAIPAEENEVKITGPVVPKSVVSKRVAHPVQ